MRQRKVKDLETKMQAVSDWLVEDPAPEAWPQESDREMYLEIGCGRGDFLLQHALAHPENYYIGIEGQDSVVLRAMEKAARIRAGKLSEEDPEWMRAAVHTTESAGAASLTRFDNIRFACAFVNGLDELFDPGSLAGIYLNFSDPWPKARHEKRRLTHRSRLQDYAKALRPGGFIAVKTDNDGLFAFTLEEIAACGWSPEALTWDLHGIGNGGASGNPSEKNADEAGAVSETGTEQEKEGQPLQEARQAMTEYEKKFHAAGKPIHYVKIVI